MRILKIQEQFAWKPHILHVLQFQESWQAQPLRWLTSEMKSTPEVDEESDQRIWNGGLKCDIMGYSPMIGGFCEAKDVINSFFHPERHMFSSAYWACTGPTRKHGRECSITVFREKNTQAEKGSLAKEIQVNWRIQDGFADVVHRDATDL